MQSGLYNSSKFKMLQFIGYQFVVTVFLGLLAIYLYWMTWLPKNFPPGPRRLPIIGSIHAFGNDHAKMHLVVDSLVRRYGPLVGLKLGGYPTVILSSLEVIKEAFVKQSDLFSGRPSWMLIPGKLHNINGKIHGLLFQDGIGWKTLRRFAVSSFRTFGVGKKSVEVKVKEECEIICEELEKYLDQPLDVATLFHKAVSNIICSICFGSRFEYGDPVFLNLLQMLDVASINISNSHPANFIPLLRLLPDRKLEEGIQNALRIKMFVRQQIEQHRETFNMDQIRDFVDLYLENEIETEAEFTKDDLEVLIFDLFTAGTETTSVSLYWLFLYVIYYSDVQTKCQLEIDHIVGAGRRPCLSDRPNLPYVTATIQEMQRLANIAPLGVPHTAKESTTLCGYFIPKDTVIIPSLFSVHMDPEHWDNPEHFCPERWILPDGTLQQKEAFMPFSVGPRMCIGDKLAKDELFLFFTAILQRFTCQIVNPSRPPSLDGNLGLTLNPARYEMVIKRRQI